MPNPYTLEDVGGVPGGPTLKNYLLGVAREKDRLGALGILSSGGPMTSTLTPTSQSVHAYSHYLYAGETITNVIVAVQTAASGTAPSNIKLGLWNSLPSPVCIAVTPELASDARWTSQGYKVCALTTPFVVATSGIYYGVFWQNGTFSVTNPILSGVLGGQGFVGASTGVGPPLGGALKTGATTMAVNDTGTYSAVAMPWVSLS